MQIGDYTDIRITAMEIQKLGLTPARAARLIPDWDNIITQYTTCGLTKDDDKLVALFGIVDHVERLTGDRCLLGLWRSQMPACLLWIIDWKFPRPDGRSTVPGLGSGLQRPERWRAPSWSWASHNLAVNFLFYKDDAVRYTEVVRTVVVRRQNSSALCEELVLQGPVVEVDVGLVQGEIASRWSEGVVGGLPVECHVRTDGTYDWNGTAKALLVMQDWACFFLLIVPVDPAEAEPTAFHRAGILLVLAEMDDEKQPGLFSTTREGGKARWSLYSKLIQLL